METNTNHFFGKKKKKALRRTLDSFVLDGRANPLEFLFFFSLKKKKQNQTLIYNHLYSPNNRMQGRPDLVNNYLSVLLIAFFDANLIESLIEIMKDSNKHLAVRATILLGEVLNLANKFILFIYFFKKKIVSFFSFSKSSNYNNYNRLLPLSVARKFLTLPKLFQLGASFEDEVIFYEFYFIVKKKDIY